MRTSLLNRMTLSVLAVITLSSTAAIGQVTTLQTLPQGTRLPNGDLVIMESKPYVIANSNKVQNFSEFIDLGDGGMHNLPLKLIFFNGDKTAPSFNWLRISIPGMPLMTEQQFVNNKVLTVDMTGELATDSNQIRVQGAGRNGATLTWLLSTPPLSVSSIHPDSVEPGQQVIISGNNFCTDPSMDQVRFNDKPGTVTNATSNQLTVTVPRGLPSGQVSVVVSVYKQTSHALPLNVKSRPTLTGMNLMSCPPLQPITIYGNNFAPNPSDNVVLFNGVQAVVESVDGDALTVDVPAIDCPCYAEITVSVGNGNPSNALTLFVQNRVY